MEYGIDKLDGSGISSITFTGATTADKTKLIIDNAEPLINAGFFKKVIDEDMVMQYYTSDKYSDVIQANAHIEVISTPKPAKIKINKRRGINNTIETMEVVA